MDCRKGSIAACGRLALICLLASATGGCGIGVATSAGFANAFNAGLFLGVASGARVDGEAPAMDPGRRVSEQDCTRPIEDTSANLKCR
jgi:hypothetical protein